MGRIGEACFGRDFLQGQVRAEKKFLRFFNPTTPQESSRCDAEMTTKKRREMGGRKRMQGRHLADLQRRIEIVPQGVGGSFHPTDLARIEARTFFHPARRNGRGRLFGLAGREEEKALQQEANPIRILRPTMFPIDGVEGPDHFIGIILQMYGASRPAGRKRGTAEADPGHERMTFRADKFTMPGAGRKQKNVSREKRPVSAGAGSWADPPITFPGEDKSQLVKGMAVPVEDSPRRKAALDRRTNFARRFPKWGQFHNLILKRYKNESEDNKNRNRTIDEAWRISDGLVSWSLMESTVRWGILGAGGIAKAFAQALPQSKTGCLAAIGSRDRNKAEAFAQGFSGIRVHGSYESLLADTAVDAIYLATPHPHHARWAIAAARAGKHLLCEKPLTLNHGEAMAVAQAAKENGTFLMEAFMYRCHPLTARWTGLIRSGALGQVGMIRATFSFRSKFDSAGRLFNNALGGGGILDVGCYTTSIARLAAGAALGMPFAEPLRLTGEANLHPETGTDLWAAAVAKFPGGIVAQLSTGVNLNQENGLWINGTEGSLYVPSPYVIAREGGKSSIFLTREGKTEEIVVETSEWLYGLEADAVGTALASGEKESPAMTIADTLGNMAALDAWRASAGLTYQSESPDFPFPTVHGRSLKKGSHSGPAMRYRTIPGIDFPVSRLVFGCDNQQTIAHGAAVWDDFFERGGNAFDTAWVYGAGRQERLLGRWIEQRGVRAETALIVKGAHTPSCFPHHLSEQLRESLDRLNTGYADMYLLHRDNPDVPVGEFVDVLNEHLQAGRVRAFGGSNWSLGRLKEANAYAEKKGLRKFDLVSNNFSLARMVSPVWGGCIAASTPEFRQWLSESGATLLAWSSQARGFFTERAGRDKTEDPELVRCWYSDDNFERRTRAVLLAKEKGVSPIHIALAYVLEQPFAPFALIGPRFIAETASTCEGLRVTLTREELSWLNLESEGH